MSQGYTRFLIACSAMSFLLLHTFSSLFWLTFIFLIPLFYAGIISRQIFFWDGFLWGLISWFLFFYAFFEMILQKTDCGFIRGFLSCALFGCYAALFAAFWIVSASSLFGHSKLFFIRWLSITFLYFKFVDTCILWPFGVIEGCPIYTPLLAFVSVPEILFCISSVGKDFLLAALISFQLAVVLMLRISCRWLLAVLIFALPFFVGFFFNRSDIFEKPIWVDQIACARVNPWHENSIWICAHKMCTVLKHAFESDARLIIMPESTFRYCLCEHHYIVEYLYEYALREDQELIVGAHRKHENKIYNSAYLCNKGTIVAFHDKEHRMVGWERLPYVCKIFDAARWLPAWKNSFDFVDEVTQNPFITMIGSFDILVCSELFFKKDDFKRSCAIVLANDAWFTSRLIPEKMYQVAQYKARCSAVSLIYVSYVYAHYIDRKGFIVPLPVL